MLDTTDGRFLRTVLAVDAATCVAAGAVMSLGAAVVAGLTSIPAGLLNAAGLSLFPIAAFMAFVASRHRVHGGAVRLIVAGNVLWVIASVWLALAGPIAPNGLGVAFILVQAGAVAVLTWLEWTGLAGMQPAGA